MSVTNPIAKRACVMALAAGLAACATTPEPSPAPIGSVEALAVDAAAAAHDVSAYRHALGLPAVRVDPTLVALAQQQADAMARADTLGHEVAGSLSARLRAAGRPDGYAVENVSAGYPTLEAALAGWRHSPGHDANLRDPHMRRLGIAATRAADTRYKTFWSLDMTD